MLCPAVSVKSRLADAARALMGISAYAARGPSAVGPTLDDTHVEELREALGGQLQQLPTTRPRWYLADLEDAQLQADRGILKTIGQLRRSFARDGLISGLTKTRTAGLVALAKRFQGDEKQVAALSATNGTRSVFDEMFPPSELALLAADGMICGIGVAVMDPVEGRDHPVMVRLDPEFLVYRWSEQRWYFNSIAGLLPITPGDGRWILHTPGGLQAPWHNGLWLALGDAFITKTHAKLARGNFSSKLANPARVAQSTLGATEEQRSGWMRQLMAWGLNSVFDMPPGWEVKLLETNGRGWEVFGTDIETANNEIMIAIAGQVVTVTGGTGFANADIHATIAGNLIKETGEGLAYTINTQGIPKWAWDNFGRATALANVARVAWDTDLPADKEAEGKAYDSIAKGVESAKRALAASGEDLDVKVLVNRWGIPVTGLTPEKPEPPAMPGAPGDPADPSADPGASPKPGIPGKPAPAAPPRKSSTADDDEEDEAT